MKRGNYYVLYTLTTVKFLELCALFRCTCRSTGYNFCGYYGYDCLDPDAPTDCESTSPTPSPAAALGYPDCTGDMTDLQNGYCDWDMNNIECGELQQPMIMRCMCTLSLIHI